MPFRAEARIINYWTAKPYRGGCKKLCFPYRILPFIAIDIFPLSFSIRLKTGELPIISAASKGKTVRFCPLPY
jgi:hypothetical protein